MEMDATYQKHLEDAQKKLSAFRSHLDLLVLGVWESKNVNQTEILAAVNELQSLVEWAAHQPDLGPESAVLLVQLQELHRIRQNLENFETKVEDHGRLYSNEVAENILCKDEILPKEHLDLCGIEPSNLEDSNETKNQENISAITSPNTSISHASESSENTDAHAIFVSDSDVADDIVECDALGFETEIKTSLNIEDNNECVKVPNAINDIEVKCLSSIKAEQFVKTSEEKKSMDYSETEAFKHVLKIEDTYLSNVEDADETVVETKCADSNKYEILEKLETDEQNLPLCDTDIILKSDTQIKELVLRDFEMLPDCSIVVQNLLCSDFEVGVETNTVVLSGDAEVLAENTVVENLFSCDTEVVADSNSVVKNMLSGDTKMIETTFVGTQDFLTNGAEAVEISNVQAHELFSRDDTVLTNNGINIKNIHSRNTLSEIPKVLRKEVIILETNEDDKTTELIGDQTNDPLDVCMFAIRNLYDSLRAKENELLKLSVIQNDQKHIDALQKVIIEFDRKITNLNSELDKTKEENSLLKEQVLELEEAENDARLEAQKLEQKLVFLQEKDSHSQTEISQMKQNLKKNTESIAKKELTEKENRSQIKYLETLVQKYEDQIKLLETRQRTASKKQKDDEERRRRAEEAAERENPFFSEKGTQTYPCQIKIDNNNGCLKVNSNNDKFGSDLSQAHHFQKEVTNKNAMENCSSDAKSVIEAADITEQCALDERDSITQKVLMERLCKLMSDDAGLQQEIHHVDQINLDLWKKLQNLENNIGECKRKDINETDPEVSSNLPCGSEENISVIKTIESNICDQANIIPQENLISIEQNEHYINERLIKFEEINKSFVKELKTRNNICKEKKKKYSEWMDTEKRLLSELKEIANERDCLVSQVVNLKKEKEELEQRFFQQQAELNALKDKNQQEIVKIRTDQEEMARQLHHKVNQLIAKEKDLLKMITKLKSERSQDQDKSELERLKSNYIELQLELSNSREEIRKLEEGFQIRLDECVKRHLQEESRLTTELERLRNEKARCDKTINDLQMKQHNLLQSLERQEKELLLTRECYRKSLEQTEEVHRSVETGLKSQLQKMEEVTVIATTAFTEERVRVEKELQDNIKDLKAKEELYKAKISELEEDVNNLHAEFHKIAEEAQNVPYVFDRIKEQRLRRSLQYLDIVLMLSTAMPFLISVSDTAGKRNRRLQKFIKPRK